MVGTAVSAKAVFSSFTQERTVMEIPKIHGLNLSAKEVGMLGDRISATSTIYSKLLNTESGRIGEEKRDPPKSAHPSSFPLCTLRLWSEFQQNGSARDGGYFLSTIMEVGNTIHQSVQKWLSGTGTKTASAWGNWECMDEKCRGRRTMEPANKCPDCEGPMLYQELHVRVGSVSGYVDLMVHDPKDKTVRIVEIKTSGDRITRNADVLHTRPQYALQANCYAYMVDKVFSGLISNRLGSRVSGSSLLFISRDNPATCREISWDRDESMEIGRRAFLAANTTWRIATDSYRRTNLKAAVKSRLCQSKEHYLNDVRKFFYGGSCHMADICILAKTNKGLEQRLLDKQD